MTKDQPRGSIKKYSIDWMSREKKLERVISPTYNNKARQTSNFPGITRDRNPLRTQSFYAAFFNTLTVFPRNTTTSFLIKSTTFFMVYEAKSMYYLPNRRWCSMLYLTNKEAKAMYYTVKTRREFENTREIAARVFYISQLFSNSRSVLW